MRESLAPYIKYVLGIFVCVRSCERGWQVLRAEKRRMKDGSVCARAGEEFRCKPGIFLPFFFLSRLYVYKLWNDI